MSEPVGPWRQRDQEAQRMPMVTVDWLEGRTPQQKTQLADALTKAFIEIANVPKEQVWILFRDVKRSDWAMGGNVLGP